MLNISVGSHGMEWTLFLQPIWCCVLDCDQTCADITDIFDIHAQSEKASSASHLVPTGSRLRVGKKLGGSSTGTADLDWPKSYPMPYDIMLSNKIGSRQLFHGNLGCRAGWTAGLPVGGGEWLPLRHLGLFKFRSGFLYFFELSLSSPMSFSPFFLPTVSPSHWSEKSNNWVGVQLLAGVNPPECMSIESFCILFL